MKKGLLNLLGIATAGAIALSSPVKALDVRVDTEVSIDGAGRVQLEDSFYFDGYFKTRTDLFDNDADGIIDIKSSQHSPEDGVVLISLNKDGMNSSEARRRGIDTEKYFESFRTYVCDWRNSPSNQVNFGDCWGLPEKNPEKSKMFLKDIQKMFLDETEEFYEREGVIVRHELYDFEPDIKVKGGLGGY